MICYLQGGMGNQMFQYAMAKAQAIKFNCNLKFNIQSFANDRMRQYALGLWKGIAAPTGNYISHSVIRERGMPFNEELLKRITPDSTLFGYWQTERYFLPIRNILKEEFIPLKELTDAAKNTLSLIESASKRSVFLHVRRTDYVHNPNHTDFHGVMPIEYYEKAISIISQKIENPILFIFSDDPSWCRRNLKFKYETHFAGTSNITTPTRLGREDEDIWLMSMCHNGIIANSTYSWWGAWLGEKEDSVFVGPRQWFLSKKEDTSDIIPSRWIKI